MAITPPEMVYDTGFVVDGIAVGFLCKTNSKIAYIDQVATAPGIPAPRREKALKVLFSALEEEARKCGFWMLAAFAGSSNMKGRFIQSGFSLGSSYSLMTKELLTEDRLCRGWR